jgi:hypothetical protein
MRRALFARTFLVFSLTSLLCAPLVQARGFDDITPREPSLKQSGHWEWAWDGSDALGVGVPAIVHYVPGGPARIAVTGPDDILQRLEVGQGQIRIQCDNDCHFNGRKLDITVSGVALNTVGLAGSSEIQLGRLSQDHLKLAISGSGRVSAEGRIDRMELSIAGSGEARLGDVAMQQADIHISGSGQVGARGRIDRVELTISGSGNARLGEVAMRQADVHIAGSGSADMTPREEADVHVVGSGKVHMAATPVRLNQSVTGSGGVRVSAD